MVEEMRLRNISRLLEQKYRCMFKDKLKLTGL